MKHIQNKDDSIVVNMVGVTKKYNMHDSKPTLIESLLNRKTKSFYALKNINIKIHKGERVGIIGRNGSGKTTLLKIITGISTPTSGTIKTAGEIASLIDLEAGFHPELTGKQNIVLNGVLFKMRPDYIKKNLQKIIKLAKIGEFIDEPFFTYSQGMKLRLGFSMAIFTNADILILDENISVGDQHFKKISSNKIDEKIKNGETVIIASHDLDFIKKHCERTIWIDNGKIKYDDKTSNIIKMYKSLY